MTERNDFQAPKWAREIERFLGVNSQFILWGNIHDVYPIPTDEGLVMGGLGDYVKEILRQAGYGFLWRYDPFKLSLLLGKMETAKEILGTSSPAATVTLGELAALAEKLVNAETPAALLINYASRLPELCNKEIEKFYYDLFNLSLSASSRRGRFNLIFLVVDKENDLPAWYSLDNPRVRVLPLPKPDHSIRRNIIRMIGPSIPGFKELESERRKDELVSLFGDQTGGLFASEIISIARLAAADKLEFIKIAEAVRQYKLGISDNPWDKLDLTRIKEAKEEITAKVIGQDQAVTHSLDIVKRSIYDLSGAQFSQTSQRPKGVMFLAGPTGVGKTELAKSLAELIFGSASNYIRFDMSEFNQEHANQRLVGAPPGYVGYDVGGELTNAVKQNPFSLILFDEIEKAHPKLMDIFLQILDDGRLTSGRGETVYFSDALIIFTSNLGIYQSTDDGRRVERIEPGMQYEDIKKEITAAISEFFISRLNRPEILNRLGPNIVVFDFIKAPEAELIFKKMLNNILIKLHDSRKIKVALEPDDQRLLFQQVCRDLSMGGRGIGNALEQAFVNPLARALFEAEAGAGESYCCHLYQDPDEQLHLKLDKAAG